MSVLLIFIDGVGIGERSENNPLSIFDDLAPLAVFKNESNSTIFDGIVVETDTRLGVSGRPQSATGQTTILTGVNAAQALGHHKLGFPNAQLREILAEHSIFLQLKHKNLGPAVFANAYTPRFFVTRPRWLSATTVAVEAAGMPFRTLDDLLSGTAIFHDFTNHSIVGVHDGILERSASEAGELLATIASANSFTLYEYFQTDKAGHARDMLRAGEILQSLALFIRSALDKTDLTRDTVIITSDHGNIEDLSTKNHTLNDVPTLIFGKRRHEIATSIKSIADITPAIVATLLETSI